MDLFDFMYEYQTSKGNKGVVKAFSEAKAKDAVKQVYGDDIVVKITKLSNKVNNDMSFDVVEL